MKYLLLGVFLLFCGTAEALYTRPMGVKSQSDWNAEYMFRYLDKDKDGRLSLDEYKQKNMTQDVKQFESLDKSMGIYRTPEEEFKMMDLAGTGYISVGDLSYYLSHHQRERNAGKKLDYPLTKTVEEIDGKKKEVIEINGIDPRYGFYHPAKAIKDIKEKPEAETGTDKNTEVKPEGEKATGTGSY